MGTLTRERIQMDEEQVDNPRAERLVRLRTGNKPIFQALVFRP